MQQYGVELRTRKYVKGYGFLSFARNIYIKQLLDTVLNSLKTAYKTFIRNKI